MSALPFLIRLSSADGWSLQWEHLSPCRERAANNGETMAQRILSLVVSHIVNCTPLLLDGDWWGARQSPNRQPIFEAKETFPTFLITARKNKINDHTPVWQRMHTRNSPLKFNVRHPRFIGEGQFYRNKEISNNTWKFECCSEYKAHTSICVGSRLPCLSSPTRLLPTYTNVRSLCHPENLPQRKGDPMTSPGCTIYISLRTLLIREPTWHDTSSVVHQGGGIGSVLSFFFYVG